MRSQQVRECAPAGRPWRICWFASCLLSCPCRVQTSLLRVCWSIWDVCRLLCLASAKLSIQYGFELILMRRCVLLLPRGVNKSNSISSSTIGFRALRHITSRNLNAHNNSKCSLIEAYNTHTSTQTLRTESNGSQGWREGCQGPSKEGTRCQKGGEEDHWSRQEEEQVRGILQDLHLQGPQTGQRLTLLSSQCVQTLKFFPLSVSTSLTLISHNCKQWIVKAMNIFLFANFVAVGRYSAWLFTDCGFVICKTMGKRT